MEYSHGWVVLWPHGGYGEFHYTRFAAMKEIVTEGWWGEAVEAAGYIRNNNFYTLLKHAGFEQKLTRVISHPDIVRKIWRRLKRREGLRLVKTTRSIQRGWADL